VFACLVKRESVCVCACVCANVKEEESVRVRDGVLERERERERATERKATPESVRKEKRGELVTSLSQPTAPRETYYSCVLFY